MRALLGAQARDDLEPESSDAFLLARGLSAILTELRWAVFEVAAPGSSQVRAWLAALLCTEAGDLDQAWRELWQTGPEACRPLLQRMTTLPAASSTWRAGIPGPTT